jgi:tRNA pseudouridine38-40 synthase
VVDSPSGTATRFRLDIAYDGTNFHGWATQRELRTVQGELQRVLSHLAGVEIELTCAGRTDAGVHARGQVAHFDASVTEQFTTARINRALPGDIRILAVNEVSSDFDARFSALWRRYSYAVCDDPRGPDPLGRGFQLDIGQELDIDAMNLAASALLGEHDFTSFCKPKERGTSVREILDLHWERVADPRTGITSAVLHVTADAFCHSMVRSLVGALIPVGQHRKPVEYPKRALEMRAREAGVTVMPAHPLVLEEVGYPPASEWAIRQQETRALRVL